jgi:hypothetical protein
MRFQFLVLLAAAISASGCQTVETDYALKTTNTQNQSVRTNAKTQATYIISRQQNSIVAVGLSPERAWNDYGKAFDIKVQNSGRRPVDFGAFAIDVSSDGQKSQVLDYTGMQRALVDRQNTKEATAMFAAVAGGVGAGLYAGSPNANPALSSAITQQVMTSVQASTVSVANSKAEADVLSGESSKSFLTNVTIPPGGTVAGIVVIPQTVGRKAEISVTVGSDAHVFLIE